MRFGARSYLAVGVIWGVAWIGIGGAQEYLPDLPLDHPAIQYFQSQPDNRVSRLDKRIRAGQVALEPREDALGYLPSLLKHLDVSVDSQALVFSKTSFQAPKISPDNPRAIYFGDDVAVAYVRGSSAIEIAVTDKELGTVFYTGDVRTVASSGLTRGEVCVRCHQGPATSGIPGMFVGSVFPGPTGLPSPVDAIITDHRTDFEDRWGGWYINATRGQQKDRSNAVASNPAQPLLLDEDRRQNLTHLFGKVNTDGYLAPISDIVALMTFEHQTQMANYITRTGWQHRLAKSDDPAGKTAASRMDADIDALVTYMLFLDEVKLPAPLEGVSTFTKTFPARGPQDSRGRSLRDFDLKQRLFRYPLSYMIYSEAFDALPAEVSAKIYRKLYDRLMDEKVVAAPQRQAILEILRETKKGLPDYWRGSSTAH